MIKVGLIRGEKSFLPENEAYFNYFSNTAEIEVKIFNSMEDADQESDIIIYYCGFFPFWKKCQSKLIMEYHSASTTRFPKLKNLLKRFLNRRGEGYIFLNQRVMDEFYFGGLPQDKYTLRGMGYPNYLNEVQRSTKKYDFVYMGTVGGRKVEPYIKQLLDFGFSVVVIGCSNSDIKSFEEIEYPKLSLFPKLSQVDALNIAKQCDFALNYTPDCYPYNFQDSTKLIEYVALGLKVVTNRYYWVNSFELEINASFLDLDKFINDKSLIRSFQFDQGDISKYTWSNVIDKSAICELIKRVYNENSNS
ncbi:hypothetical protein [Pseudoalteromonas distincta]|uniref:hypothetical protein n=1 Tax=Pseudoalteromonas distincta TaxID=77608 RepID=UPI0039EB8063